MIEKCSTAKNSNHHSLAINNKDSTADYFLAGKNRDVEQKNKY